MKVGILSDIHGNFPALQAVVDAGKTKNVEKWVFLGDLVGYYYWPKACFEALQDLKAVCIKGNHERMMLEARRDCAALKRFTQKYGQGFKVALEELSQEQIDFIEQWQDFLELSIDDRSVFLCHGSPQDRDVYVYPDAGQSVREAMCVAARGVTLYGHTHYQVCWRLKEGFVINPGSVGQPRDRRPGAHWALWDTETMEVELNCEEYDIDRVIEACLTYDAELTYLSEVLTRTEKELRR